MEFSSRSIADIQLGAQTKKPTWQEPLGSCHAGLLYNALPN